MSGRDPRVNARVLQAAAESAGRGWWVFPTEANGKRPRAGLKWPAAATNDPEVAVRCAWRPGENYGIAAKPSRLVIVDLDQPKPGYQLPTNWRGESGVVNGWDVLAALAERNGITQWPCTFTVTTPSGGAHLYYVAPAGRSIGNKPLGPMIDVRGGGEGDGGYVLGPGSVLNGRIYGVVDDQPPVPLPGWIADLLDPPRRADIPAPRPEAQPSDRVAARLDGLIAKALGAQPGERNNLLYWAACHAAQMVAAGQLTADQVHDSLGRAAACVGLDDGEASRTIASALRHVLRSCA